MSEVSNLPPIKEMVGNVATTISDSFKVLVQSGQVFVDESIANKRLEICKACECLIVDQMRCSKCGCFMTTKVKLIAADCPASKW
jgi:hypothetical protein